MLFTRAGKHILVNDHQVSGAHIPARAHNIRNQHENNILPRIGGPHSVPESEISFPSFLVLVDVRAYPRVLSYMKMGWRHFLNGMCSVKNDGFPEMWSLGTGRIAVFCLYSFENNSKFKANLVFALARSISTLFQNRFKKLFIFFSIV